MKRFAVQMALAIAAAFALTAATPAFAGEGCEKCAKGAKKEQAAAAHEHKAGEGCEKCAHHKDAAAPDKAEKKDAQPAEKAAPAPAAAEKKAEAAAKCECQKGGKGCVCKKGECKCENCGAHKFAAGEKPKCECGKGGDCKCAKGECKCAHPKHA